MDEFVCWSTKNYNIYTKYENLLKKIEYDIINKFPYSLKKKIYEVINKFQDSLTKMEYYVINKFPYSLKKIVYEVINKFQDSLKKIKYDTVVNKFPDSLKKIAYGGKYLKLPKNIREFYYFGKDKFEITEDVYNLNLFIYDECQKIIIKNNCTNINILIDKSINKNCSLKNIKFPEKISKLVIKLDKNNINNNNNNIILVNHIKVKQYTNDIMRLLVLEDII